jgi:hypothetical protein
MFCSQVLCGQLLAKLKTVVFSIGSVYILAQWRGFINL